MVERSLSMREVRGSISRISILCFFPAYSWIPAFFQLSLRKVAAIQLLVGVPFCFVQTAVSHLTSVRDDDRLQMFGDQGASNFTNEISKTMQLHAIQISKPYTLLCCQNKFIQKGDTRKTISLCIRLRSVAIPSISHRVYHDIFFFTCNSV